MSLRVPAGTIYGLVGPNGAGKTTLLSILAGTRRPQAGSVEISVPRQRVAVCPDVPEFDGWLTAFEVVDLARAYVAPDLDGEAVLDALRTAGLDHAADHKVGGFSRGMTQRLGLATTLVGQPELIILDEPTSALDPAGRVEILSLVAGLRGRATVVFSSHILADVQRVADHVSVLRAGRVLYEGPIQTLIDEHLQPRWRIRLASDREGVVRALQSEDWVARVATGPDEVVVETTSLEAGQRLLPGVLASVGARLVSIEPVDADLEAAFLALTGEERA
ncbi:MAG TPA: ABC transporter ATP-binding protein [Acidimicrobiales bacterium]|nr:ABC transporter ATP-binding protein [Acidimicrobiales bacterium]